MNDSPNQNAADAELVQRVIYSLLRPAVRMAHANRVSLKDLGEWAQMAYFHEAKRRGGTLQTIARHVGASVRNVARLSKKLKSNFLRPELEHELPCRIEFALWPGPMTEGRIKQALRDVDPDEIDAALKALESEGRVERIEGRTPKWRLLAAVDRRVAPGLYARIDALNALGQVMHNAVQGRFFDADEAAFARTLTLRVRQKDLARLRALYEDHIWPTLASLDADAKADSGAIPMEVGVLWAPFQNESSAQVQTDETQ